MSKMRTRSKILKVKNHEADTLHEEVKLLRESMECEQKKLDSLMKAFEETRESFYKRHECDVTCTQEMGMLYESIERLSFGIRSQKEELMKKISEFNERQSVLLGVYKEKKLFEKMKDRVVEEMDRGRSMKERKEIDFVSLLKHTRS